MISILRRRQSIIPIRFKRGQITSLAILVSARSPDRDFNLKEVEL